MDAGTDAIPAGNGCDFWPESLAGMDWTRCCDVHDLAYAAGGDWLARLVVDFQLALCVNAVVPGMGWVMLAGVGAFGWLFWTWRRKSPR
jgi:hypothetical protein